MNPKLELSRLVVLTGGMTEPQSGPCYDPETLLMQPDISVELAKLRDLEIKCGLSEDLKLTPQQRVDRLKAFIEKPKTLSATAKPKCEVRFTDSKGKTHIDMGAIFDNEQTGIAGIPVE
jgi:hypothetical protein